MRAAEQLAAKTTLAEAVSREAQRMGASLLAARYRAFQLQPLLKRYYTKADKEGRALRKRALTKKLELTLSAFFGGDWLAFLNYIGEEPHPEEYVATALPETRLYLSPSRKVAEDFSAKGVDEEQLRLIARSLYGGEVSPIERRSNTLKRYWEAFDAIHARQRSGMEPLLGLVEDHGYFDLSNMHGDNVAYRRGLYRRLIPADLLKDIDELWGTIMVPREPGRIVTEPFPHVLVAETFGPALRLWHGCALTAWFLCEGPYSRTDMAGLEHYHRRELAELEDLGAPVDRRMFGELIVAEEHLGPEEPAYWETQQIEVEPGIITETTMSRGSRREGFERLRDLVTKHRRAWAEKHLDSYLQTRAEGDVREVANTFHRKTVERGGKPPTVKQFAGTAAGPTNRWFGGDISALYRAFGEKPPLSPERVRLVPEDIESFVRRVFWALDGVEVGPPLLLAGYDQHEREEYYQNRTENAKKEGLANMALHYLRLQETLGRAPTLKEFGKDRFAYHAEAAGLNADLEKAWADYETIVRNVLMPDQSAKESVRDAESREHSRLGGGEDERHINLIDDHNQLPEDRRHEHVTPSRGAWRS